jgi:ribosomal protein S3AE
MVYKEFTNSNTEKARKIQSVLTELKRYVNTFDFPQAYIAEFIERIFKRETSSVFPLRDYPPEIRKSIAEKTDQILKKLGT